MNNLEIILLGLVLFSPAIDIINEKYKSKNKNFEFLKISLFLWIPTFLLAYLFYSAELSVTTFDYAIENNWQNVLVFSLILLAIIYWLVLIKSICSSEDLRTEIASKFAPYIDIMPVTKGQVLIFTLVLSVSAGICEELIFRAYLYTLMDTYLGMTGAILLSSVLFGFWHIYLGWQEVIRTSIMGSLFCGIYIFTGNIILPILLHIFIDVYSGTMCYFAMRKLADPVPLNLS
jgi:membrane protease YdiL (CAAX protease family)